MIPPPQKLRRGSGGGLLALMHSSENRKGGKGWLPPVGEQEGARDPKVAITPRWSSYLFTLLLEDFGEDQKVVSSLSCILARAGVEVKAAFLPLLAIEKARS